MNHDQQLSEIKEYKKNQLSQKEREIEEKKKNLEDGVEPLGSGAMKNDVSFGLFP